MQSHLVLFAFALTAAGLPVALVPQVETRWGKPQRAKAPKLIRTALIDQKTTSASAVVAWIGDTVHERGVDILLTDENRFGNQVRAVVSGIVLSQWLGVPFCVNGIASQTHHFRLSWEDNFLAPVLNFSKANITEIWGNRMFAGAGRDEGSILQPSMRNSKRCADFNTTCDYFEEGCLKPDFEAEIRQKTVALMTIFALKPCAMSNKQYDATKMSFYASVVPHPVLASRVRALTDNFGGKRVVGVHFRHSDNCGASPKTPLGGCRSLEEFAQVMADEKVRFPNTSFYFSSDDSHAYTQICKLPKASSFDGVCKGMQLGTPKQPFLVELLTLSCTEKIIGSATSTYSGEAGNFGGIPVWDWDAQKYLLPFEAVPAWQVESAFAHRRSQLCTPYAN